MRGVSRKGKKRKGKTEPDNLEQSARFIKAARELGVDESGAAFDRAMDSLIPPKKRGKVPK